MVTLKPRPPPPLPPSTMASDKPLSLLILLLIVLSLASSLVLGHDVDQVQGEMYRRDHHYRYGPGGVRITQCPGACGRRCFRTHYKKPCLFFCNKCCRKCLCVPPGFYGNKQVCPCYNNWKTKRGGPKCP